MSANRKSPNELRDDAALLEWVFKTFGVQIPNKRVCRNHRAPAEAFCDAYFARAPVSIWKGSRGFGGKSFTLGLLGVTLGCTLKADVTVLGGSGAQSARILEGMTKLWAAADAPRHLLSGDPGSRTTKFKDGQQIIALTASQNSVRGPHPQVLLLDEIDEMAMPILEAAQGQPMDRGAVRARTVMSSTHQNPDGTMTEMLKRAVEKDWPVYEWSIAQGTRIWTRRGWCPIETLRTNDDEVLTRSGWRRVRHVTLMGLKTVRTIRIVESGAALRVTGDHRVSTPRGWVRAERLRVGDALTSTTIGFPETEPTVASSIARGDVGVLGSVIVPLWAVGACDLCGDVGSAGHVDAMNDVVQVVRVAACAVAARRDVVEFEPNVSLEDTPGEAMSALLAPGIHRLPHNAVAVGVACELPDPAVGFLVNGDASHDVGGVHDNGRDLTVRAIRAGLTSLSLSSPDDTAAIPTYAHVASISDGAVLVPVWDIGVEHEHEFIAEGIVVHNCWRETLEPHGWLTRDQVERKRREISTQMWDTEYDLQEPSAEGRAIDTEAVAHMFRRKLGEFKGGSDGELVVIEKRKADGRYAHGGDWAKKKDHTVILTLRVDVTPMRLVAFQRIQRRPWPQMVKLLDQRIRMYGISRYAAAHDATGVGDVVAGYLEHEVEPFIMAGRPRADLLSEYIAAVENGEIVAPFIESMEGEHKYATVDDVYGSGHLPDTIAAGALAYRASKSVPTIDQDEALAVGEDYNVGREKRERF